MGLPLMFIPLVLARERLRADDRLISLTTLSTAPIGM